MSFELMEKVVDDFEEYLKTNMPAKLDALEVEYADTITLDDIKAYYIAEEKSIPEYPAVFILGDNVVPTQQGASWINGQFNFTIACITIDQDSQTLKRKLYRYMRAIAELVKTCQSANKVDIGDIEYSPIYGNDDAFLSDARIIVTVIKTENL
jgi:hypothetical protein